MIITLTVLVMAVKALVMMVTSLIMEAVVAVMVMTALAISRADLGVLWGKDNSREKRLAGRFFNLLCKNQMIGIRSFESTNLKILMIGQMAGLESR